MIHTMYERKLGLIPGETAVSLCGSGAGGKLYKRGLFGSQRDK